jgi:hypothetical protein
MVTVRRSTFTSLSTTGIRIISPGPLTGISLPSLNITPLSYSRRILIILARAKIARKIKNRIDVIKFTGIANLLFF